jgi:hypothetical protein
MTGQVGPRTGQRPSSRAPSAAEEYWLTVIVSEK